MKESWSVRVEVDVLRRALQRLLDHVEEVNGAVVEVPEDLYWFVQADCLNDPTRDPTNLTLGSLDDDWAEVSAIGRGTKEPVGRSLVWASSILRAVGERTI